LPATCWAEPSEHAGQLAQAVNAAKVAFGGQQGGAFAINEFGQVIVPVYDEGTHHLLVGECRGSLQFNDPLSGEMFDLTGGEHLSCGDPWILPYLGIRHNLTQWGKIYFWHQDESGERSEYPPAQDPELISRLRSIRAYGPIRFLVNPHGIVLTKLPAGADEDEEQWTPVFAGRIRYSLWFNKED
jgi:hypothetical protein